MNYGFHLSTAGVITQMRKLDVIANNLANVETVGFKPDFLVAVDRKPERLENSNSAGIEPNALLERLGGGKLFLPTQTDFSGGAIEPTGRDLDAAIKGEGFFMLESRDSKSSDKFLTRNGNFEVNTKGHLVLSTSGQAVLDQDGARIQIDPTKKILVGNDGTVSQDGSAIAQLAIVKPARADTMVKDGHNAFRVRGGKILSMIGGASEIQQGALERSGTDPVRTLASMIATTRALEFGTQMMRTQDEMTGRLFQTFGRMS
ncbi:MAG: flagellar hook-basal body protein [Planctomycetota bacterium]|nr:MAG: flagellar hook-basal body protein [Planctomycetota bacterium]RLS95565.1 MAG: flagellar hook-basal body protein [Planctomycetota bacterium]RLT00794.1 MAG: flagellar hook-basal body protein [Planctomycetota bacterium]